MECKTGEGQFYASFSAGAKLHPKLGEGIVDSLYYPEDTMDPVGRIPTVVFGGKMLTDIQITPIFDTEDISVIRQVETEAKEY